MTKQHREYKILRQNVFGGSYKPTPPKCTVSHCANGPGWPLWQINFSLLIAQIWLLMTQNDWLWSGMTYHGSEGCQVVAQPTRWSPIVIWVFVGQSSSWPWEPHIRGFKLLKPVLRTQMAVFDPVYCKMYLLYGSCPRRKSSSSNFCLFSSQNDCFLQPLEGTWQLSWFGVHSGRTPNWDYWFGVNSLSS